MFLQKHSHVQGGRAREGNVIGLPFWPQQAFRSLGLLFLTAAVIVLIAGFVEINPVWIYGPFVPYAPQRARAAGLVSRLAEGRAADGPADRADDPRRHDPGAVHAGHRGAGHRDRRACSVAVHRGAPDRTTTASTTCSTGWWENPYRTATGAAFMALFLVTTLAGGNDVLAAFFNVPVER